MPETKQTAEIDSDYKELTHTFHDLFSGQEVTVSCRFRRPTVQSANRCQKTMAKSPGGAFKALCQDVAHPADKDKLSKAFDDYPGVASTFGNELLKSIGFGELGN